MTVDPMFLSYLFNGWRFEFFADRIETVNPFNRDRYKIALDPYSDTPFTIMLIERGAPPDQER